MEVIVQLCVNADGSAEPAGVVATFTRTDFTSTEAYDLDPRGFFDLLAALDACRDVMRAELAAQHDTSDPRPGGQP